MAGDAYAPKHWPQNYVHFINTWGQDKVMWGTDWPVLEPERCIAEIEELNLRPEPRRKLLRENALRVFGKLESSLASRMVQQSAPPEERQDVLDVDARV
jgi:predicted TIM-barrel fold metal-dependent hydrolase